MHRWSLGIPTGISPTDLLVHVQAKTLAEIQDLMKQDYLDEEKLVRIVSFSRTDLHRALAGQALAQLKEVKPQSLEQAVRYAPEAAATEAWNRLISFADDPCVTACIRRLAAHCQSYPFCALAKAELKKRE
ncbi:MAG: hypothetical protein V1738_06395 [Patescibacteria group bacterium]